MGLFASSKNLPESQIFAHYYDVMTYLYNTKSEISILIYDFLFP